MLVFFSFTVISISMSLCYTVSAITYSSSADIDFTINPTINLTLSSSDLIISNLAPGNYADSNIVTVGVSTNAGYGYYLSATTNSNTLTNTTNNSYVFNNLSTTAGTASTLANITPGYWGYSYSTDNGSTWKSGSSGNTATGYAGLPLDNNDSGSTGVKLLSTDSYASSGSIKFKIGAKATNTQVVGTYTGTVNFYAVTNPEPLLTMQNVRRNDCTTTPSTVIDSRDGTEYHIARLADDKCWMLDNLALDLLDTNILNSLSSANTNIDPNDETNILTSLKSGNRSTGNQYANGPIGDLTEGNSYSVARANLASKDIVPSDTISQTGGCKIGGYYNYCAASAGSYCYGNGTDAGTSSGDATSDICPKGWRMPTGNTDSEYQTLYTNYHSYYNYRTALHLPLSGHFDSGSTVNQGSLGYFWSSARKNNYYNYYLDINANSVHLYSGARYSGLSVRCLLNP